jgi:hypothetical protein
LDMSITAILGVCTIFWAVNKFTYYILVFRNELYIPWYWPVMYFKSFYDVAIFCMYIIHNVYT